MSNNTKFSFLLKKIQKLYFLRNLGIHLDVFCVSAINRELDSPSRGHHPNLCADLFVHQSFQLNAILEFVNLERRDAYCSVSLLQN